MQNLEKLLKLRTTKLNNLERTFQKIISRISNLKENLDKFSVLDILNILGLIAFEIQKLKQYFQSKEKFLSKNLFLDYSTQEYFSDIEKSIEKRGTKKNLDFHFNLCEAIEELYKTLEIFSSYKITNQSDNYIWNILYEIYLNLEQHYLYHYKEVKKYSKFYE